MLIATASHVLLSHAQPKDLPGCSLRWHHMPRSFSSGCSHSPEEAEQLAQCVGNKHPAQEIPESSGEPTGQSAHCSMLHSPRSAVLLGYNRSTFWVLPRGWGVHCSLITFHVPSPLEVPSLQRRRNLVCNWPRQVPLLWGKP